MPAQVFVGSVDDDGNRTYLNKGQNRKYFAKRYSNSLYSDDSGRTWTPSAPFPLLGTAEPALAELRDGRVGTNCIRALPAKHNRFVTDLSIENFSHIHDDGIHRNLAQDRGALTLDKNRPAILCDPAVSGGVSD